MDWVAWHDDYDQPGSSLAVRLGIVQGLFVDALAHCPSGPLRVASACAGQGRDVVEVLRDHPRRDDVRARLIELDADNVAYARASIAAAGLSGTVEVVAADAGQAASYVGAVPADIVLMCGVFGNISDGDIRGTVLALPELSAANGSVIWTRHRRSPDLTPAIRQWFAEAGYAGVAFAGPTDTEVGVGMHQLTTRPRTLIEDRQYFTFNR